MLRVLEVSGLIEQPCLVLSCTLNELAGTRVAAVRLVQCPEKSHEIVPHGWICVEEMERVPAGCVCPSTCNPCIFFYDYNSSGAAG